MNSRLDYKLQFPTFDLLISQQQRLSLLSKTEEIGEWSYSISTDMVFWSDYLYDFYELERDFECSTLLETTQYYQDAEKEKMRRLIAQAITTKKEQSESFMIQMKDGRIKWHTTTVFPILDRHHELIGLYGILKNITPKKTANAVADQKQLPYRHILDELPTELTIFNHQGHYLYANRAALKCHGLTKNSPAKPCDTLESWISADESKRSSVLDACMRQKQPVTYEEKFDDSEGIERTCLRTLYPLLDKSGNTEFVIGYGMDITSRKRNELELQRIAYVAEKTNGIVMITDPQKKIIWINQSFEKILGYTAEEVIGIDPAAFLQGPETSKETIQAIAHSLKSTGTFSGEILNYTKSGEKIWLYLNIAAVYNDAGQLINYVAVENDITLIKQAEERLQKTMEKERELNRFKTQFVSLASHQFRTPLATIRSSIDLLDLKMESAGLDPEFIKLFHRQKTIMAEETLRMTELMENILDIGRIDEGKIELTKQDVPFKQFMDTFVASNNELSGNQRTLNYRFNAPNHVISLDEIVLRNVLRNIVSNAFKYSLNKPEPELIVNFQNNVFVIAVKDYGIGIPERDQAFLFQSFFRASNAKTIPGSGLGLMIAQKLIRLHGGDMVIKSKIGHGCTVTIQLPVS